MVQCDWHDDAKHWWRKARCYGLAEVFARFGDRYTAKQLYRYYLAARILVHKRVHGKSAPERTEAAQQQSNRAVPWQGLDSVGHWQRTREAACMGSRSKVRARFCWPLATYEGCSGQGSRSKVRARFRRPLATHEGCSG